ncbi:hypothetical protein CASFOL_030911 [Castilleja foliolosa]|uniref:Uncharacterized protein n=1 Tax=Castilleja foliolosa TaxID=1961234 RepID=A0ABD3C9P4_9LAMI
MATKIVEQCQVAPPAGAPAEQLLKLLHMDMPFLCFPFSVKHLFFYKLHCSESHFMDTIVPSLKNSLSLTLKHFLPMASKIFIDNNSGMPVSQYVAGQDSVPLTIVVSYTDFVNLSGYHPRDTAQLHSFSPHLSDTFSMTSRLDVLAIQLTLFPNQGVCIGIKNNHAICDGASLILFINKWASINKLNGDDDDDLAALPFYDRDLVKDGYMRSMECWRDVSPLLSHSASPVLISTVTLNKHMLEATFVLGVPDIRKLMNLVIASNSGLIRVSSFVVVCAYLWSCMAKSDAIAGEEVGDDEVDYFVFPVNCRGHLDPPLPENYFGNCSALVTTESTYGKLKGEKGFSVAAEMISIAIEKTVGNGVDGSVGK